MALNITLHNRQRYCAQRGCNLTFPCFAASNEICSSDTIVPIADNLKAGANPLKKLTNAKEQRTQAHIHISVIIVRSELIVVVISISLSTTNKDTARSAVAT